MQVTEWTGREAHALRLALRMSVRGFAERLGAAPRTISDWDRRLGSITPGHEMQAALDTLLDRADQMAVDRFADLLGDIGGRRVTLLQESPTPPTSALSALPRSKPLEGPRQEPPIDKTLNTSEAAPELDQRRWREIRAELNSRRSRLAKLAVKLYPDDVRLPRTALITSKAWLPKTPIALADVALAWSSGPQDRAITGTEAFVAGALPLRDDVNRYERYTAAIRYLDPPRLFENRPSFRLLDVGVDSTLSLRFGLSTYFEKLDVSEAIGHEFATACLHHSHDDDVVPEWRHLPYRRAIGDPFDLGTRSVNPAITTLTILHDQDSGHASFLMHWRDASKVATAGGLYDVIPAGEFQPASIDPWHHELDLDLWRNMVREYSEELLGEPEHDGSRGDPLDYDHWPLYRNLCKARDDERVRAYVLGIGLDALTLAATIPTVVVFDRRTFTEIFGAPVTVNAEGTVVADQPSREDMPGIPFTEANVDRFLDKEPIAPPGAACLALSWNHRHELLPLARPGR